MTAVVQESVSGIRLVKSFGGESYEETRFREGSGRYARGMVRVTRLAVLAQPITETVGTAIARSEGRSRLDYAQGPQGAR
jgi:ABC-type multidrug transport system fused ATPase/permease subunit